MIQEKIAEQLKAISPSVEKSVVDVIVEREVTKRSNVIVQALDKLEKLERDLKRFKPDQVSYDVAGTVVSEAYSKPKLDERNKLVANIKRGKEAIDKALNGDMDNVTKFAQGGDQQADS